MRRSRVVQGGKKKKVLPKSSFRQRYVEAERRRAGACSELEGLNEAARAHPAFFTERVVTIVKSHSDPGPGDVDRAVRQAPIGPVGPAGGDRAAATALASHHAGFQADIAPGPSLDPLQTSATRANG